LLIIIAFLLGIFILIRVALYYFHIKDVKTIQKYLPVAKKELKGLALL